MRPLGKLQVTANFANDNKFILIANIFLITLVLKCLLHCQSSSLMCSLKKTLSYQSTLSSWVAAAGNDLTFLLTQAPFKSQGRKRPCPQNLLEF